MKNDKFELDRNSITYQIIGGVSKEYALGNFYKNICRQIRGFFLISTGFTQQQERQHWLEEVSIKND